MILTAAALFACGIAIVTEVMDLHGLPEIASRIKRVTAWDTAHPGLDESAFSTSTINQGRFWKVSIKKRT